jgi:voltage-gated sodium channel
VTDVALQTGLREHVRRLVERPEFTRLVTVVIIVNAVTLGLETWPRAMDVAGPALRFIDRTALWLFTIELALKLFAYRLAFFRRGWNLFDLAVVGAAWLPAGGPLSVLRALRVLRVLRLLSVVPQMRKVVGALFSALPGMGAVVAVLMLVFYVAAVMATKLYGAAFPQWFGSIGESMYTLFQIMTLESWSMGIVRPVMAEYPLSWMFFVPFVVITSFAVLNLFIALIVNSMQTLHEQDRQEAVQAELVAHDEREELLEEIRSLRREVHALATARAGTQPQQE